MFFIKNQILNSPNHLIVRLIKLATQNAGNGTSNLHVVTTSMIQVEGVVMYLLICLNAAIIGVDHNSEGFFYRAVTKPKYILYYCSLM